MFEVNEDYEDEELPEDEEEILVYVEFPNCIENNMFGNERLKLDMIGIDSETPIMQINGKFYEGSYEDAVGTYMFFEKENNATVDDPVFEVAPTLKYMTKSRKVLRMQRVFVTPRTEVLGHSVHEESIPNMETIIEAGVPPKYQEEALAFWAEARAERIEALNAYLEKQRVRREKRAQGICPVSDSDEDDPFMLRVNHHEEEEAGEGEGEEEVEDGLIEEEDNLSDSITEMNEFERYLRNTAEKPLEAYQEHEAGDSQIEPQPSTSREVKPFIGKNIVRNKGTVKVIKNIRRKNNSKYQKIAVKRKPVRKQNFGLETSTGDLLYEEVRREMDTSMPMYENFQPLDAVNESEVEETEFITDEIQVDQKPRYSLKKENSLMDKRLRKKVKREAKMKEISEQLKKMSGISQEEEGEEELII